MNTGIYTVIANRIPAIGEATIKEIAQDSEMSAATVRRYVTEMVNRGEVAVVNGNQYRKAVRCPRCRETTPCISGVSISGGACAHPSLGAQA